MTGCFPHSLTQITMGTACILRVHLQEQRVWQPRASGPALPSPRTEPVHSVPHAGRSMVLQNSLLFLRAWALWRYLGSLQVREVMWCRILRSVFPALTELPADWYHVTLVFLFILHLRVQLSPACSKWTSPSSCLPPQPSTLFSSSPQRLPPDPYHSGSCPRRSEVIEAQPCP